ncbi:MAG: RlmE family RNA methyltransferase, partial [Candidatus Absconditabacteria bacterium]
ELNLPGVSTYQQDITDQDAVKAILAEHKLEQVDFIQSDMAPNTTGVKDLDAMRSIGLIEQTLWMYQTILKPNGKFVIKIFMGPGFQEFIAQLKQIFGGANIKVFKPKSCRKESKETYIIKI